MIAFKDFKPLLGFGQSEWVGFKHFIDFFQGPYFWRVVKNTLLLNVWGIAFGFTAPIILSLMLNEIRGVKFKKVVQTITYMPHFISWWWYAGSFISLPQMKGLSRKSCNLLPEKSTLHCSATLRSSGRFIPSPAFGRASAGIASSTLRR